MLCHCPAGLAEWLTRHWSPLFFLATKTHDLRRRNSAHPPPLEIQYSTADRRCRRFALTPPRSEILSSSLPVFPPLLSWGRGALFAFLATCFPSSSSSRLWHPPLLPRDQRPLLFFLAAAAPYSSSSRARPPPLLPPGHSNFFASWILSERLLDGALMSFVSSSWTLVLPHYVLLCVVCRL